MKLKLAKKLIKPPIKSKKNKNNAIESSIIKHYTEKLESTEQNNTTWEKAKYIFVYALFILIFLSISISLINLQVVQGNVLSERAKNNHLEIRTIYPARGSILDRNGNKLVENVPAYRVFIQVDKYLDEYGDPKEKEVKIVTDKLQEILGKNWKEYSLKEGEEYNSLGDKVTDYLKKYSYYSDLAIAYNLNNEQAIEIKESLDELNGIYIDDYTKRNYPYGEIYAHLLGYTAKVNAEDLENLDYVDFNDTVGKIGVEKFYDEKLIGKKGKTALEVDAFLTPISEAQMIIEKEEPGMNLYLTIDKNAQEILYDSLRNGVSQFGANGGVGIIQDVKTGEIIAIASYPSYDNNLFTSGISEEDYSNLLNDTRYPLFDRTISAQQPPGSIFKTIVAASALDAGALTPDTIYTSRSDYTFSNGAEFGDAGDVGWGDLNVIGGIEVSSNIFFCETIRHWDMYELVPYLEKWGIGDYTGIDLPGEMPGRIPSPDIKIYLATTSSPWLDPIWYPEGDSCNSVIGQGITLITPIQAVNWTSAIANGGTLHTPHVGLKFVDADGNETPIAFEEKQTNIVDPWTLVYVRQGMHEAVYGYRPFLWMLRDLPFSIAGKTGTAEFGRLNADGSYEHTHAWNIGFFPYEDPKYAYVFFLEDGGAGNNAAWVARDFLSRFRW